MAPPRHRSPGYSRRAQYALFAGYVIAVSGIVIGLALVAIARLDPQGFAILRGTTLDITAPVTGAGRSAVNWVASLDDGIVAYVDAGRQNGRLRRENDIARRKLVEARAIRAENRRLRALLRLVERTPQTVVTTRIVGSTTSGSRRLATLAAGFNQGVRPGQPVRAPEGLIGRIFETGRGSSRVLMISDGGSTVPVVLARGGLPALALGTGDGRLRLRPLIAGENPFRRGDLAITSGTGGLYPPGIPVAIVTATDNDGAIAWPLADPARVDLVLVQGVYAPDAVRPIAAPGTAAPPPAAPAP
ncbi:rod shape-determining protein MreC [Sphingomonas sp. 1P06PA]|uniref:rod shape-determining protein MreC n=1 Tax=Sphingomonas sp. 1P06PA TaxID=554121 RepID=UPI0039A6E2D9